MDADLDPDLMLRMRHPDQQELAGRLTIYRQLFSNSEQQALFGQLDKQTQWLQTCIHQSSGREIKLPRLTANYGERSYDYSGFVFQPTPWTPLLSSLKQVAESLTQETFNALILQFYRDGKDSVGWHSDSDPCVAAVTTIVSMSFGGTRTFQVRSKQDPNTRLELSLAGGDLLVMSGDLQQHYMHKVPKQPGAKARINLTFRQVLP